MSILLNGNLKVSVFGESHSESIGVVIEHFPAGLRVDLDAVAADMARRKASMSPYSTKRLEPDVPEVQCGIRDGYTTGAAICLLIRNRNVRSADYANLKKVPRPSHADWPAHVKYGGFEDYRGGGQFSGRLTAPIVAAGSLAGQWLAERGVSVAARIGSIAGISAGPKPAGVSAEEYRQVPGEIWEEMLEEIRRTAAEKDSCGGTVEGRISGLPAGLGGPMADSVESRLSSLLYAVPAVKGVSFGLGFGFASARGKEVNDPYTVREGRIVPAANRNGGVLGGITTGADVLFTAAFKPVPSIAAVQDSVDTETLEPVRLEIKGRHDVCIVPRAVPVVEGAAALCAMDLMLEGR